MAHYYGRLEGARGPASRLGTKKSGLVVEACSWQGKVHTSLWHDDERDIDMCSVELRSHHGHGRGIVLYLGPVSGEGFPGGTCTAQDIRDYARAVDRLSNSALATGDNKL